METLLMSAFSKFNQMQKPVIIYCLGFTFGVLALMAPDLCKSHASTHASTHAYDWESIIAISLQSKDFKYSMFLCLGISIPIFLDYIIDLISDKANQNQGFFPRGLIICALCVPDTIIIGYISTNQLYIHLGCLYYARLLIYVTASSAYLVEFGGGIFKTKMFPIFFIPASLALLIRGFLTVIHSEILETVLFVLFIFLCAMCTFFCHKWFQFLWNIRLDEYSTSQTSCTTYMICTMLGFLFPHILDYQFDININENSSITALLSYQFIFTILVVILTSLHNRMQRIEQIRTQKSLERKRVFVRLVSHEIRTPLNIVVTGLKLIQKEADRMDDCVPEFLDTISDTKGSVTSAIDLLNDLLTYEKLEAGLVSLERTEVRAWTFLKDAVRPFNVQARQCGIELKFTDEVSLSELLKYTCLHADKHKLEQVIRNLISNALKFTPSGGAVIISASLTNDCMLQGHNDTDTNTGRNSNTSSIVSNTTFTHQQNHYPMSIPMSLSLSMSFNGNNKRRTQYLRIDIKDTGHGIAKENLPRLFKEIIQFSAGKLQNGGGSGLGLWLARSIVHLHDGQIYATSEGEGQGCTFSILLPCEQNEDMLETSIRSPQQLKQQPSYRRFAYDPSSSLSSRIVPIQKQIENKYKLDRTSSNSSIRLINTIRCQVIEPKKRNERIDTLNEDQKECDALPFHALMVDDSIMGRKMLRRALVDKFASIHEAEDGLVAVGLVKKAMETGHDYHIIMMDYQMPNMDGPTASKEIRAMGFKGFILGVTGNALPEDIATFMSHGADRVLTKPFDMDDLECIIDEQRRIQQSKRRDSTFLKSSLSCTF